MPVGCVCVRFWVGTSLCRRVKEKDSEKEREIELTERFVSKLTSCTIHSILFGIAVGGILGTLLRMRNNLGTSE